MNDSRKYLLFLTISISFHFWLLSSKQLMSLLVTQTKTEPQEKALQIVHIKLMGIENGDLLNSAYIKFSEESTDLLADLSPYSKKQHKDDKLYFKNGTQAKKQKNEFSADDEILAKNPEAKIKIRHGKESIRAEMGDGAFFTQNQTPLFSNTNMNINVKVPRGVGLDKLNRPDLMYNSFMVRLSQTFQTSFFRNLNSYLMSNPHFPDLIPNYRQNLSGLLTYDREGNLLRIQTLRLSDEEHLSEYFMQVLNDVHTIQNLPEPLINDREEFQVTVNLNLN